MNLAFFYLGGSPISCEREWGFLDSGGACVFWTCKVGELGRVFGDDLLADLSQLFLSYGQAHTEDFEHLEFHLPNVPTTEDASDIRPIAVGVGEIEGILERQTRIWKGRSVIVGNRGRKNSANRRGEDQRAEEQSMQDPIQRGDIHVNFRPPQVDQRDKDRRGARPAPLDDIPDKTMETAILAVHPI